MMNEPILKKKKKYTNKVISGIFSLCLMIIVVGISYAFFIYNKTGLYTHTINGGKMGVSYNETTGNNITIDNAYPRTDKEALTYGLEFEFTITGYNESNVNVYYAIEMDHGADVAGKDRFLDSDMKLSLYENDEVVFENEIFNNLDNQSIHYGIIDAGTSQSSPTVNNYKLRIWINNYVYISNTIENDTTLWDDSDWDWFNDNDDIPYGLWEQIWYGDVQYLSDIGVSVYTSEEFANHYTNFKVNVIANLTAEDLGYVYYDAGGGEYEPKATSVLTNKITMQKPVMVNKGFLGWSTEPNDNTVEYYSGEHYSGAGMALYAVYSDTRNVMGNLDAISYEYANGTDYITQVLFVNDTQESIDAKAANASYSTDVTYNNQGKVTAWIETDTETSEDTLYIGSEGTTYLSVGEKLFYGYTNVRTYDFYNADTSMVTSMRGMFAYFLKSEAGGMSNDLFDYEHNDLIFQENGTDDKISQIASAAPIYGDIVLDLSIFNTSSVTTMESMFEDFGMLRDLNISSFDTSKVTDMSYMFSGCYSLSNLYKNEFDTSSVTDMSYMFSGCDLLADLDVSEFNTSLVTDMSGMFSGCSDLISLDVSEWDTAKVNSMSGMFEHCYSLVNLVGINNFNTSKVIYMDNMFYYCGGLVVLDLNNWDIGQVTDMSNMFESCYSLTTIYCNNDWNTGVVTSSYHMFYRCTDLVGAIKYNGSDAHDYNVIYANPDTGFFTRKNA